MNNLKDEQIIENSLVSVVTQVSDMNKKGYLFAFSSSNEFEKLYHLFQNINKLFFSKKLFEEVLGKFYAKFKWTNNSSSSLLSNLKVFFRNNKDNYHFISVLNHVDVRERSILGKVQFVKMTNENYSVLINEFRHSELVGFKDKDVIIYGPFSAESYDEARRIGLLKIKEFINILRIVFDFIDDGNSGFKTHFGVEAYAYGQYASFDKNFYFPETTWSRQFNISNELMEIKNSKSLTRLWSIIDSVDEYTEIEQRIVDSLHWFGISKMSYDNKQQFISYFTLLEGLLFAGSVGSKTSDLAERITKIYFCNSNGPFDKKDEFYQDIRRLYKLRGDLIHEAKSKISIEDLKKLNKIVRETFIKYLIISTDQSFKTKNDLRIWTLRQSM